MMKVALVGANGHGRHHRRQLSTWEGGRLVALCDTAPVDGAEVPVYQDHQAMLAEVKPDVVIVSTPPATHLPIAAAALRAGADVLLEKPPVLDLDEHERLSEVAAETGRAVQVGFQALAAPYLPELRALARAQAPCDVSVFASWQRDDAYWERSAWAGRPPLDGALRNPFAHAVMQALAVQAGEPVGVEVVWGRIREIGVDDTATLRLTLADGGRVLIAVTLAGESFVDSRMRVGDLELDYRVDSGLPLLENLAAHRRDGTPLLAPLAATRGFTLVAQTLGTFPTPGLLPSTGGVIPGINAALERCAAEFRLLDEIDGPWTATATRAAATLGTT